MEEENRQENKGLSIAAMVLGIVSVVLFCVWYISVPCAILAIIFGVIEKKKNKNNKFAKSGFILGIISLVITIIFVIVMLSITVSMSNSLFNAASDANEKLTETMELENQIQKELELQNQIKYNNYNYNFD